MFVRQNDLRNSGPPDSKEEEDDTRFGSINMGNRIHSASPGFGRISFRQDFDIVRWFAYYISFQY